MRENIGIDRGSAAEQSAPSSPSASGRKDDTYQLVMEAKTAS
jgi:hypothetical protein